VAAVVFRNSLRDLFESTECLEFMTNPLLNETAMDFARGEELPMVGGHCQCSWRMK
jgi:hypothetical protein